MPTRRVFGITGVIAGWTLATFCAAAQTQNAPTLPTAFEAVAIHHPPSDRPLSNLTAPGGKELREQGISLEILIQLAFGVESYQLTAPEWISSDSFDVTATTGSDIPLSREQMRPLIQQMLIDRFKLKYHRETKPFKGYELMPAKSGLKLKAAAEPTSGGYILANEVRFPGADMKVLAAILASITHKPVADKTGIAGTYALDIKFDRQQGGETEDSGLPSLFTALQEQAGLQLKPAEVPVDMLVVDHIEKEPTEN
jgi:uncharacterized protein (TIGR03435 family)